MKDKDFKNIFDDDYKSKKKHKKKNKKKKNKHHDHHTVYIYSDFISALMASKYTDDVKIDRYKMKKSQISIVEKDGSLNIDKVRSVNFSMNETSLGILMDNNFTKHRIKVKENVCFSGTNYTVVKVKMDDLIEIMDYSMSLTSDKGNEITKIFTNLYGIHDANIVDKDKKNLGVFIRG